MDLSAEEEAIKSHLDQLKKDETALHEERRMLEGEKAAHQKELKRCQSEDRSRFTKVVINTPPFFEKKTNGHDDVLCKPFHTSFIS